MTLRVPVLLLVLHVAYAAGCDRDSDRAAESASTRAASQDESSTPASNPASLAARGSKVPRVVFLGDSLTAGLGVDADEAFPAVVAEMLRQQSRPVEIVNAGVSGDTTAGGLRRLDWLLRQKPDVVVVGLGGNDGLRGLDVKASEQNLREIVRKSRESGAAVLLLGMLIPPNYGPEYTAAFREIYPRVAGDTGAALVPFLLEGVGGEARLNLPDGIHPTADGHRVIAGNVVKPLRVLLPAGPPPP